MRSNVCYAHRDDRALIHIGGGQASDFLQSILTANIDLIAENSFAPGALLTPQGRILFDLVIYRHADAFTIECDAPRVDDLFARLRRYRLRRPIDLAIRDDAGLWIIWGGAGPDDMPCGAPDPRGIITKRPDLGTRHIAPDAPIHDALAPGDIATWHAVRIAAGIPEGPVDLPAERALMLECGLDRLGAVDFSKGCYIGQEVTARTHYRGLVKRRLVPLVIAGKAEPGANIMGDDMVLATTRSCAPTADGTITLAGLKLSDIHRITADETALSVNNAPAHLAVPDWMLPLPDPAKTDK